ncbi:MAG: TRAP transporter substrate-binding protein DctP [Burkholderiaceae bacterium]
MKIPAWFKPAAGVTAGAALAVGLFASPAVQAQEARNFAVVGTWGQLDHWIKRESKFWNETLPKASGGKLTANAKPLTELGLGGNKVMREVKAGAFDFAHGVFLYIAGDSPVIEGADLSGVVPDLPTFRKAMNAYKPVLQREFTDKFDSTILMLYPWPQTHMFCKMPADTGANVDLSAFKGMKIRSFGTSVSDFITNVLHAAPVPVPFGEVLPGLQKGLIDCGATGVLSAYNAKWYQAASHEVVYSLGYTASFLAVNNKVWASLTDDQRKLIQSEVAKLEEQMWSATAQDDETGLACNTDGPCPNGEAGGMKAVRLSDKARADVKAALPSAVLASWAKRCNAKSPGCSDDWNKTIGALIGLEAKE